MARCRGGLVKIFSVIAPLRFFRFSFSLSPSSYGYSGSNQPFVDAASWRESDMATIARHFFDGHRNIFLPAIGWAGPGENYVGYEFQLTTYVTSILYPLRALWRS